jgi:acyl-coenzyme A synthetase/AMP-(fatty) acid ligase/3-hydroxymyristoyl/3-hydroxydecanoyl-(acyl carrier protein) dehydratase
MTRSLPLSLNTNEFPPDHIIAYLMNGQPITWAKILLRLEALHSELQGIDRIRVAVYHSDKIEFLCLILTLWRMGKIPVIPVNALDSTLRSVEMETDCFIGEFSGRDYPPPRDLAKQDTSIDKIKDNYQPVALIMFTSGSSGAPKAVYKTFDQINAEIRILEEHWGADLKNTITIGTVSHNHMYGLPFLLLWPLTTGRAFFNLNLVYFEQLHSVRQFDITLISSPTLLENVPDILDLQKSIKMIFSAGAPLSESGAENARKKTGAVVMEIYGSTETGAVAYRNQNIAERWTPLNGISVQKSDNKLAVNSPAAVKNSWYVTEDLCEIYQDNQFLILGRADKIIKVGEKRISINAIELCLKEHPWITKVQALQLNKHKNRVGAVIQLTDNGNGYLVDQGKLATIRELIPLLQNNIEKVGWPRYWRFVSKFPVNQQGKTTNQELEALFSDETRSLLPQILESSADEESGEHILQFIVPNDLLCLEGHFPGKPILPGVVQVQWVMHFCNELFGVSGKRFLRLEVLKFQKIILPGERIYLGIRWDNQKNVATFRYTRKDHSLSSGRVVFTGAN